jgi:hypothetical protein
VTAQHSTFTAPPVGDPGVTLLLAPSVPDLSGLQGLEPGVAYAALATVALGMLLFYLGPGLRQRFTRPDPPTPTAAVEPPLVTSGPLPAALPAAMDRADAVYDRLVGHLEQQLADRNRTIAEQVRELDRRANETERLRNELERLRDQLQWGSRGTP